MHEEEIPEYINEDELPMDDFNYFRRACAFCRGTGVHPATMKLLSHQRCPVCEGKGVLEYNSNRRNYNNHCHRCDATGREPQTTDIIPCKECKGYGRMLIVKQ